MIPDEQDAFGALLRDLAAGKSALEIVERDDGYIDGYPADAYVAPFRKWHAVERRAMRFVRGRVLDVGVGAGRLALELQERGHDVVGIDVSPLAVEVARARGVRDVRLQRVQDVNDALGSFDTVVMLCNNFGVLESVRGAKRLLRRLHAVTTERGRIVGASNDVTRTERTEHLAYHRRNLARGRLRGQLRLRVRHGTRATPWFDYLELHPDELRAVCEGTGWHVERVIEHEDDSYYAAVLEKG